MNKTGSAVSAPGKVILAGEHAVVYGYPALVTAVSRRLTARVLGTGAMYVQSQIPIGCGMGSSAAYAVVTSALKMLASGQGLEKDKICEAAYEMEKQTHGSPSGVDNTICTYGGFLWYRKESEKVKFFKEIKPAIKINRFTLINSGTPFESTKEMVSMVRDRYQAGPSRIEKLFKKIEIFSRQWLRYLTGETTENLIDLIRESERCLEDLGVVSAKARKIIRAIERMGGAAKVSGAGGKKNGSGIILSYGIDKKELGIICSKMKADVFEVKLGVEGVKREYS